MRGEGPAEGGPPGDGLPVVGHVGSIDHPRAQLGVILVGLFAVSCSITVLSNSLDSLAGDLNSSRSVVLWSITAPMLAFGLVGPTLGKLGDLHGHRRLFLFGLVASGLFAVATVFAWNAASMVALRTLSATCGSATSPAAVAYINRLFPGADRVRALGWWSFTTAGAPVIGVVLGAPAVEAVGWRVIFAVQGPLCLIAAAVAARLLVDTPRRDRVQLDLAGAACLGAGALSVLLAVNRSTEWGWWSPRLVGLLGIGVASLVALVRVERRAVEPLIPLAQVRRRLVALPIAGQSLANFAYMGSFMLTPALLQNVLGMSQTKSGFVLVVRPLALALAAAAAGGLVARAGEWRSSVGGVALVCVSMFAFAAVDDSRGLWLVIAALALAGVGVGISSPPFAAMVAANVDARDLGVVGALQQLSNSLGAVLGAEVMQTIQQAAGAGSTSSGYAAGYLVAAIVAGVGVVVAGAVPHRTAPADRISS